MGVNGREIVRKLEAAGWRLKRIAGSHHIMGKGEKTISIPVHGNKDVKKGTMRAIQKSAGVKLS